MIYVIYVGAGKEKTVETCIKNMILQNSRRKNAADTVLKEGDLCTSCFYPVRHMRKKIRGSWTDYFERMMPGYVFVESENILELYEELCRLPFFMKILGKEKQRDSVAFQALQENEERWLYRMMGEHPEQGITVEEPIIELSQIGFDENDQVKVLSGPLKSMTGMIRKIDLHRRRAEVEVEFMGRKISIYLGIELLDKKK